METKAQKNTIPEFRAGDTVTVHYRIIEGDKVRTQPFEGIVIAKRGEGVSKTFTVRKIGADGVGVERIFPLFSPNIERLVVERTGKVRRAKLYYLRGKVGKQATKVKERLFTSSVPEQSVEEKAV
ncbi:50S ribosomal protein L19 [candidate division WWE3 bacterium RIFCSPHIGHO2_01_FULL_43_9]|uniref:Large ribosomal subunit protein bL19 n=1 Tax=candidate division WWE3 bacterium RIFCSPHIGHO2_01_FULL_43_9 TaxID=1802618 RepID=A0A1F4V597_UNCKA|nr:MAG: 50S ribosomal protein L19 [candidate division WWE3 bacterium RIFCSPHIGHO2_01_FULL_43_9]